MSFFSKTELRRILAVGLVSVTIFLGTFLSIGKSDRALAEVLKRDAVGMDEQNSLTDTEYESAKARRNQQQAEMSQQAEDKAKAEAESETVAEKLNLGEIDPPGLDDILD